MRKEEFKYKRRSSGVLRLSEVPEHIVANIPIAVSKNERTRRDDFVDLKLHIRKPNRTLE